LASSARSSTPTSTVTHHRRNKKDENDLPQTWSRSQLHAMLRNPKYTGYNVWGRHDKRSGRPFIRPREQWIWSPTPSHEPLVSRELFEQVEARAQRNNPAKNLGPLGYPPRRLGRVGRIYPLRGRVRCGICGRRMEGSHQKGSNWYRCRFVTLRGPAAADASGHPRVLGIKEDIVLDAAFDFLGRRIFGPNRLGLLREEIARTSDSSNDERQTELARLAHEDDQIGRALYRQALRLEEHDDPNHPVVALATQRIEELSARRHAIDERTRQLKAARPAGPTADEIEALLNSIPDLRSVMRQAPPDELTELFAAFDLIATYDKEQRALRLAATLSPRTHPRLTKTRPPKRRSGKSFIAGAGFEPATSGL
jgi:site-specific DNA recombinase